MALKFLNKKGWHTGSLRNIENVWKAEQKHDAEQKKLEELRKQIHEEKEKQEFRLLQEQAGLIPKQERLDFLYESGLAVGKSSSSDGFKSLETLPGTSSAAAATPSEPSSSKEASVLGALFEDKPHSANDAWRKLHSDPLLMIRKREQEALARVKNNPFQMAMIRKTVEVEKHKEKKEKKHSDKSERKKHRHGKSKHHKDLSSERDFDSEDVSTEKWRRKDDHDRSLNYDERPYSEDGRSKKDVKNEKDHHRDSKYAEKTSYNQLDRRAPINDDRDSRKRHHDKPKKGDLDRSLNYDERPYSEDGRSKKDFKSDKDHHRDSKYAEKTSYDQQDRRAPITDDRDFSKRHHDKSKRERDSSEGRPITHSDHHKDSRRVGEVRSYESTVSETPRESHQKQHRRTTTKLTEEERAARLREMQQDAEMHEEQRWKRLKKAAEEDAQEAKQSAAPSSRNFLDATQKSIYGAEKGGSSTIEESIRRRTYYSQGKSEIDGNAFRR